MSPRLSFIIMALVLCAGCGSPTKVEPPPPSLLKKAKVTVRTEVLSQYVGVYQFPSGALLRVQLVDDQLLAGEPPKPLLPQTTREFASNGAPVEYIFEPISGSDACRLNYRVGKRDLWLDRVDSGTLDPTQLISVGAHRLRMLVLGESGPTIVIEDGFGSSIELRAEMQTELAKISRVVCYEHAGTGGSEEGSNPRNAKQTAVELHTMLQNAKLAPPYVLIGGSIGGEYIRVFAHQYPDDVAGIVLLDPTPNWDELLDWMRRQTPNEVASFEKTIRLNDQAIDEMMRTQDPGRQAEWRALAETRELAQQAFPLPKVPFVQITGAGGQATNRMAKNKVDYFSSWLRRQIPHARHVLAKRSGHAIFATQPGLVMREVHKLVSEHRREHPEPKAPPSGPDR